MLRTAARRRVLVVDDHALVGLGMRSLLTCQNWVEDCVTADGLDQALAAMSRVKPHLAVIDLFVGDELGLTICRRLKEISPHLVVVLTSGVGHTSRSVYRAAGASGFISKATSPEILLESLRRVMHDSSEVDTSQVESLESVLSARQLEVLREIATGATNIEAAENLFMSPHTVKQHTQTIYRKLGARNRAEAVGLAQRIGLIE